MNKFLYNILLLLILIIISCKTEFIEIESELQSFEFKILSPENLGSERELLPSDTNRIVFRIKALGSKGEDPFVLNKEISLYLNFGGKSTYLKDVKIINGLSNEETIEITNVYGKAHLMVVDDRGEEPTYASGSSDEIYFRNPSLYEIQKSNEEKPPFSSNMRGYRVSIRGQKNNIGMMIVTAVTNNGFYISDYASKTDNPTSLFVYNFSRPYGVHRYQLLCQLIGRVQEHLGNTQVTFPDWMTYDDCKQADSLLCKYCIEELRPLEGKIKKIEPIKLKTSTTYDKKLMESLESSLVEIEKATILNMFESSYDRDTYNEYGQYRVRLNDETASAIFLIISRDNVSDFDPTKYIGKDFSYVRGILTELNFGSENSKWIINVRDKYDICVEDFCPKKD
ncbi:MAG: hypothetical protein N2746_05590 [Deltaproteobacteria bacterium]|nr:hypothetical protein [Deltaproteobacteria bacterium]